MFSKTLKRTVKGKPNRVVSLLRSKRVGGHNLCHPVGEFFENVFFIIFVHILSFSKTKTKTDNPHCECFYAGRWLHPA